MMSPDFIDWWFAPWTYAIGIGDLAGTEELMARRDGYREWCSAAQVISELPPECDAQWTSAALIDGAALQHAATLFMGLIAARQQDQNALAQIPLVERRWCLSVAATQPLHAYAVDHPDDHQELPLRGLAELAIRLDHGFPGLWSRLRLTLPESTRAAVALRLQNSWADQDILMQAASRSQRCWRLCRQRVTTTGDSS